MSLLATESRPPRITHRPTDVRRGGVGAWAYVLNRITGVGLVVYLYLHLAVLSLLVGGEDSWDSFVDLAQSDVVLGLDVLLLAGLLIHSLNGIRITVVTLGIGVRFQRAMFVGAMAVGGITLAVLTALIFGS
jgi:succinate dehydrogenase / fumarate reductase cytochrome b subunit